MFKRLRERIAEEATKLPVGQLGNNFGKQSDSENKQPGSFSNEDLITLSESSSVIVPHTSLQQFSIGEDEEGSLSEQNTPNKAQKDSSNGSAPNTPAQKEDQLGLMLDFQRYRPTKSHYVPQSDIESGREDPPTLNLDGISKDQLLRIIDSYKARVHKHKNKYSDVVKNYKELREEKIKIENALIEHQDKSLRRIAELREQCQLEQKAKADLDANLRMMLEEKDSRISVLETQNNLLKESGSSHGSTYNEPLRAADDCAPGDNLAKGDIEEASEMREKIERLEHQLNQAKKAISSQPDQLSALRKQIESLTQELEDREKKLKEVELDHAGVVQALKARLTVLEGNQEESVMSMAETKRNMHEEMQLKERQLVKAEEEAKQFKESWESEKNKVLEFQKLHEEKVNKLQQQLETTEKVLESEKQNLMQELNRGKSAAVVLVQQDCAKRIACVEEEWKAKLENLQNEKGNLFESQIEEARLKLSDLEEQLKLAEQRSNELNSLACKLENENMTLKKSLEDKKIEKLQSQSGSAIKGAEEKLENVEKNYNTQLEEMRNQISLLANEKGAIESQNSELQKLVANQKEEDARLRCELESKTKTMQQKLVMSLKSKDEELKNLQRQYEANNQEQMEKMKDRENTIVKLKSHIELLTKESSEKEVDMKKRIKLLEEEREKLMFQAQERIAKCREEFKSLQEATNKLIEENKEIEELKSKLNGVEKLLQDSRHQSQSIEDAANKEIIQLKEFIEDAERKALEADQSKKTIKDLSDQVKKLQEENSFLLGKTNHVESLKAEKQELNEKLKQIEQQVATVKQLELDKDRLKRENETISEQLKSSMAQSQALQEKVLELEDLSLEHGKVLKDIEASQMKASSLEERQAALITEKDSLKKENEGLCAEINQLKLIPADDDSLLQQIKRLENTKISMRATMDKIVKEREKIESEYEMLKEASEKEKHLLKLQNLSLIKQTALLEQFDTTDKDSSALKEYVSTVKADCEAAMKAKEEEMQIKLKHLVKDVSDQMDMKDKDSDKMLAELIEKNQDTEDRMVKEHQLELSSLRQNLFEKECALDEMRDFYEEELQAKDKKLKEYELSVKTIPHPTAGSLSSDPFHANAESSDWDDTWVVPDEVIENTSPTHCDSTCKDHLQKIETLEDELSKCNSEIKDLKLLLGLNEPETIISNNNRRDSLQSIPEPTEFEYLKNIIFEYMMGKEPITLAKVIAAVLRFSDSQTQQVIRREEARHPMLSHWMGS